MRKRKDCTADSVELNAVSKITSVSGAISLTDLNHFQTIHAGHLQVYDHHVHRIHADMFDCHLSIGSRRYQIAFQFKNIGKRLSCNMFIINDKKLCFIVFLLVVERYGSTRRSRAVRSSSNVPLCLSIIL